MSKSVEQDPVSETEKEGGVFSESVLPHVHIARQECHNNTNATAHNYFSLSAQPSFKAGREKYEDNLPFRDLSCHWYENQAMTQSISELSESLNSTQTPPISETVLPASNAEVAIEKPEGVFAKSRSSPQADTERSKCEDYTNETAMIHSEHHHFYPLSFLKQSSLKADRGKPADILPLRNLSCHWYEGHVKQSQKIKSEMKQNSDVIPLNSSHSWYKRRGQLA